MTDQIVLYGKGGAGTSTLTSNVSAALVEAGFRVLQIGCSPKGDSSAILNGGFHIPTVWDEYQKSGTITFDTVVKRGFKEIFCIELGSPEEGHGSASALQAVELLFRHDLITLLSPDFVFYDISGDYGWGVVNALSEKVNLHRIFAVTTADLKSLDSANRIMEQLKRRSESQKIIPFGGLLLNNISSSFEESFISDFARRSGSQTVGKVPRSLLVRQCELYGKTVIEASPLSNQSYLYRRVANQIVDESQRLTVKRQPVPLTQAEFRRLSRDWADRLFALENGLVTDGAAI